MNNVQINSPAASVGSQQNDVKSPLIKVQLLGEDTGDIVTESLWDNDKPEYVVCIYSNTKKKFLC